MGNDVVLKPTRELLNKAQPCAPASVRQKGIAQKKSVMNRANSAKKTLKYSFPTGREIEPVGFKV